MKSKGEQRPFAVPKTIRGVCYMTAILMLCYALVMKDVPLGMLAFSLVTGLIPSTFAVNEQGFVYEVQKMMYGFSFTLFVGAMVMLIFY